MKIQNLVVLITGGCSGLGLESARLMVAKGARVALVDLNDQNGQQCVKELGGPKVARYYRADVAKEDDVANAFKRAFEDFGEIRVFLNCAGIAHFEMIVNKEKSHRLSTFQRIQDVNVTGTFLCCKYAALHLKGLSVIGKERGLIMNIASIYAKMGTRGMTAYSASKGAVLGMTMPLARDLGPLKIRVVTLSPSVLKTPMTAVMPDKMIKILMRESATRDLAPPSDFANLVKGVIENEYLNATTIEFWGGLVLPNL